MNDQRGDRCSTHLFMAGRTADALASTEGAHWRTLNAIAALCVVLSTERLSDPTENRCFVWDNTMAFSLRSSAVAFFLNSSWFHIFADELLDCSLLASI